VDSSKDFASNYNIMYAVSLGANFKFPVCHWSTGTLNASHVEAMFTKATEALYQFDFVVVAGCADGASENRKFMRSSLTLTPRMILGDAAVQNCPYADFPVAMRHPCDPDAHIFLISDPPHGIKKLRNAAYSSGAFVKSTRLLQEGQGDERGYITWMDVYAIWQKVDGDCQGPKSARRLNKENFILTPWTKMRVWLAANVLSSDFAYMIDE